MSPFDFAIHPRFRVLQRFVDGDLTPATRRRVADHLARCRRCRETVAFSREVTTAAKSLPGVAAPSHVLAELLADHAAGERVILPLHDAAAPRDGTRALRLTLTAAALVAVGVLAVVRPTVRGGAAVVPPPDSLPTLRGVATTLGLLPATAYGQELPPNEPSVPPIAGLDASAIGPMTVSYEITVTADPGAVQKPEHTIVTIAGAEVNGAPAWRIVNHSTDHQPDPAETTYVDRATLRPLTRIAYNVGRSRYTVEQRFDADSLLGTMRTTQQRWPLARRVPPPATIGPWVVGGGMPIALLRSVKLHPQWRGRAAVIGWGAVHSDLVYPVTLTVTGEERIRIRSGACDCWRLSLSDARREQTLWVRKSDQLLVLLRDTTRTPGQVREVALVSVRFHE